MIPFLDNYHTHLGKKVYVYWNLTKKCWSVRHKGKVLFHASYLELDDCTLKVSEAGRQRVLLQKKKYVHAGVEGKLADWWFGDSVQLAADGERIGYNPYKGGTFFEYSSNMPRLKARKVTMRPDREVIATQLPLNLYPTT